MNIQYIMTDEVAFKLGKFDFPDRIYQFVSWRLNKEPFELAHFFNWSLGGGLGGWGFICKPCETGYEIDWENQVISGSVKLDLIKDISHKLAYIRGRLEGYSVTITDTSISVGYANSHNFRDFLAECFADVLNDRFFGGEWSIEKGESRFTIPGTPHVILTASEEIVKFIVGNSV